MDTPDDKDMLMRKLARNILYLILGHCLYSIIYIRKD